MINLRLLKRALVIGLILELGVVACGYVWPYFRHSLLFNVMLMAAVAGMLYARDLGRGFLEGMLGGGIAGAACGLAAVSAAFWLGERPEIFLPWAVMVTTLTGTVGGVFGELDARLRAYIIRKLTG